MKRVSALIVAVMIAVFSIPQLRVHAEGSGVVGAFVYDGSPDSFSGENNVSAKLIYKLTQAEYASNNFESMLSNIPASPSGYSNYLLACSGTTLSLYYFPEGAFGVFYDNFSSSNRLSYADKYGLSNIRNYGCSFSAYINSETSPTPFEQFTCTIGSTSWSSVQNYNMYYTNIGTGYHYNYIDLGIKSLIGGNTPVYSVGQAVNYDDSMSQNNSFMPPLIENMDSLTNFNAGNIPVYNGTSMVIPEPDAQIETISNHLYAKNFDVFFCSSTQLINNRYGFASVGGGYLCVKYELDDYALANIGSLVLSFNYSVTLGEHIYTGAYQGRLDSSGYVIIPINQAFQNKPMLLSIPGMCLVCDNSSFYQNYCNMTPYYFTQLEWQGLKNIYEEQGEDDPKLTQFLTTALKYTPFVFVLDSYEPTVDPFDIPISPGTVELMKLSDYLAGNLKATPDLSVAKFDCVCKLLNEQDIFETSGDFKKTINFKTGVGSITDNGITVNPNPFDDIGTYDIVPNNGEYGMVSGGNAYATVGNIVNQITIPGYKELKADIDATPDGNFTQFLAPFYNNEVGAWFFSFVDDMPPEMKAILISGCGVGVLFGIARYVRRS